MSKLNELLNEEHISYILPFLWMHGEEHEIIKEEIDKIEECGIREICLESRPHPDFCGKQWWEDVDFIIKEAKKRNMKIWILDDDKFPTGHACGAYEIKYPQLAKWYLAEKHMDVIGPVKEGAVLINPFLGKDGKLLKILALRKPDTETLAVSPEGMLDLTENLQDDFVYFNLPEGRYRLFVLFTTQEGGGRKNYINLIDTQSVKVLIDEVYESHFNRYKDEFGETLAGFFSDEPELGNTPGYDFHEILGKRDVRLPWSEELSTELYKIWGDKFVNNLPALWYDMGEKTAAIRSCYMDKVTALVNRCFSGQIGSWCEEHGIRYIGHIIEDDNAHARLGCSIGHYFREQKGQHMSGIDVVHFQIQPGFNEKIHQWIAGDGDGEFFHYGLAKLGASCAHIDPKKKGRALCEIFGNYGWAEGVSFMKWLTNHMLVRGINHFVPHAFSPKFPDRDCPPHFYARGNNPQFKYFAELMKYMNRACHLLNGGIHQADAAVLYHGEAEWSGGEYMLFQKPVRKLMEEQLDCDIIPADIFTETFVGIKDKKLIIHKESYESLIIPYCRYLSRTAIDFILNASGEGLNIYMLENYPEGDTCKNPLPEKFKEAVTIVKLNALAEQIKKTQRIEISCEGYDSNLRFYCYKQGEEKVYLFFNENYTNQINTKVKITDTGYTSMKMYDPQRNESRIYLLENDSFLLHLEPGELKIIIPGTDSIKAIQPPKLTETYSVSCDWQVSLKEAGEDQKFTVKFRINAGEELPNINGPKFFSSFSGIIRYEGEFYLNKKEINSEAEECRLYMKRFGDCAEITINGKNAGILLSCPDRLDVTAFIKPGLNHFIIDITNTLVWKLRDGASTHMQVYATGLNEVPVLEFYLKKSH